MKKKEDIWTEAGNEKKDFSKRDKAGWQIGWF